ncbi:methyl-accepting chemotaxis protein [Anaerotaenia torta]|uniref:methyl-accepting chemotaxis protein n=1 Tax=Anaerotaenia torta TaxID=433293 RepID=UPI003D200381
MKNPAKQRETKESNHRNGRLGIRSVKYEILFRLLPVVLAAMIALSFMGYYTSRQIIQADTEQQMVLNLSTAVEKIEKSLAKNRKVAEALAQAVAANASVMREENYRKFMPAILETNSETFGGGIWFEPYAHDPQEKYFSPYCMLENGKMTYFDDYSLGEGIYYTDMDWYTNVKNTDQSAVWSDPYYDDYAKISMVTASSPFYDASGKLLGVATADIDLTELQKMIISLQVKEGDKAFLLDPNGTYIADNDSSKLLKANIVQESNASLAELGKAVLSQKQGTGSFEENGRKYLAWYTQIPESGWIVALASTEAQLFHEVDALANSLTILCAVLALLVSGALIFFVQGKVVKPLKNLVGVTGRIADGDLNVTIDSRIHNEIGVVFASIKRTSDRLHDYIDYIGEVSGVLDQIATGNLDYRLQLHYVGEFEKLKVSLERIRSSLSRTLSVINTAAVQVNTGASQVSNGAQSLAEGSAEQAATVSKLGTSVAQVTEQAQKNLENVKIALDSANQAGDGVIAGNERMKELTAAMSNINSASGQIVQITKTIEDIAFQTNILALNAAIEAARAGTAGKGFSVVADEVRNLAVKSAEAAKQTAQLIEDSVAAVVNGSRLTEQTAEILQNVLQMEKVANEGLCKIEQASSEQTNALEQIREGLAQVSSIVQNNAAASEENSAISEEMSSQAAILHKEVRKFKLSLEQEGGRTESPSLPEKRPAVNIMRPEAKTAWGKY